jgi:hypothetical protein
MSADGFMLLFSMTNERTYTLGLNLMIEMRKKFSRPGVPGILVGTFNDKKKKDKFITEAELKKTSQKLSLDYAATDATSFFSSRSAFRTIMHSMLDRWEPIIDPILKEDN